MAQLIDSLRKALILILHILSNYTKQIIILSILSVCLHVIVKYKKNPRLVKFASTVPGPKAFPIVGNAIDFIVAGIDGTNKKLTEYSERYGTLYRLWIGKHLLIVMADVDHIEAVFRSTKTLGKPEIFKPFHEFWGNGLFTGPTPIWKKNRKNLQSIFSKNVLKHQLDTFHTLATTYANLMEKHANGIEFDVYDYFSYLGVDAMTKIYFGLDLDWNEKKYFNFHRISQFAGLYGFSRIFSPWLRYRLIGDIYYRKEISQIKRKFRKIYEKVVEEKLPLLEKTESEEFGNTDSLWKLFLTNITELEKEIPNLVYDEVTEMAVGVSDTLGLTNSFFSLLVAMHPKIQNKLYAELYSIFGDDNRMPTVDDIQRLTYLDQVVKEVQRRFTILPLVFREVLEDVKIGSRTLPAGSELMLRLGDIHMNPIFYPDPKAFNPNNFSPEAVAKRPKYAFLPFSAGTRDCIGKYFADLSIKISQIILLRKYTFSTTTKMEDVSCAGSGFTSGKSDGFYLSIKLREPHES